MIRMIQSQSAAHAKSYFNEALSQTDYYVNEQETKGLVRGKIADRLGIAGDITKFRFDALCENINPMTGQSLTQRNVANRTIGYDINFHVPKSVSVLNALSKDDHILEAFQESVNDAMLQIESDAKTRVRKGGENDDRDTGELIWVDFIHHTARPVADEVPDPHLHAHCYTFNVSYDKIEQKFKAGQFRDIKRHMPYYQARFHKTLADKLVMMGYQVRPTKTSFEVEGIPQQVIDIFCKRTDEIGRIAKENNITNAKQLDKIGARSRAKKKKGLTMAQLKKEWRKQILAMGMSEGNAGGVLIRDTSRVFSSSLVAKECINHSILHHFERSSVAPERRLIETAHRFAIGNPCVPLSDIEDAFKNDQRIIKVRERSGVLCSTIEVLDEEKRMVSLARQGMGKCKPLYDEMPPINLTGDQKGAVEHILTNSHRIAIIQGRAGTGKTTLMKEAVRFMQEAGKKVTLAAPTAEASRGVLRSEGFEEAETVAKLLTDTKRQADLKDGVLWVDEAGLLGIKDMNALLELVEASNARLILSGDTRQHSSVIRGDALRILNTVAGIVSADVSKIYRQKHTVYREAVEALANGDVQTGFEKLNSLGAIKTIDPMSPHQQIIEDYANAITKGKSALIISPTHEQGRKVTQHVRDKLKQLEKIGKEDISCKRLINLSLTEAEKQQGHLYQSGYKLQFNQNRQNFNKGSLWTVESATPHDLALINAANQRKKMPLETCHDFDVYREVDIQISKGDVLRMTRNGIDADKRRLNNGQILSVTGFGKDGSLLLQNAISKAKYHLQKDFGHIDHAYCITSHASQGKTVDEVFIMQPASTFPATDMKQFYVSVSRARHAVHIYTDDMDSLFDHIKETGDKTSALELADKMIVTHIAEDGNASTSVVHNNTAQTINSSSGAFKKHEPTPNF